MVFGSVPFTLRIFHCILIYCIIFHCLLIQQIEFSSLNYQFHNKIESLENLLLKVDVNKTPKSQRSLGKDLVYNNTFHPHIMKFKNSVNERSTLRNAKNFDALGVLKDFLRPNIAIDWFADGRKSYHQNITICTVTLFSLFINVSNCFFFSTIFN